MDPGRFEASMLFSRDCKYSHEVKSVKVSYHKTAEKSIMKLVEETLTENDHRGDCCYTVSDYGTADGAMSLSTMNKIIDFIRRNSKQPDKDILLVYEDQSYNNFNALCQTITGRAPHQKERLKKDGNIHALISCQSMYSSCLPRNSLDFGFTFSALQWMSKRSTIIKDGIFQNHANNAELQLMKKQAATDWNNFLKSRSYEMKPGACLFVVCQGLKQSDFNWDIFEHKRRVLLDMVDEKHITREEFENINVDWYFRTEEDFREPFQNETHQAYGLKLLSVTINTRDVLNPLTESEQKGGVTCKRLLYRKTHFIKSVNHNSILSGFSSARSTAEKQKLMEIYYRKFEEYQKSGMFKYQMVLDIAEVILKKEN